ncbi:MAG: universal stress protein [Gemmatimonadaceae bacterium]
MYHRILVPLENTVTDSGILDHVRELARHCGSSLIVIHVADGWAARNIAHLNLRESEELRVDREYIERIATTLSDEGIPTEALLASGDPAREIISAAERENCDLIAMATHGHKFIGDVIHGSVANSVRHETSIPVLLLRAVVPARRPQES